MSPTLNGSSAIRCFKRSDAIKIRDGITFDFYTGLSHIDTVLTQLILFDLREGNRAGYCTLVLYSDSTVACENTATHPCNIQSYRLLTIKYTYIIYVYIRAK